MSWAKLDDRFHENRKIKRVWRRCPAAVGLHVMAITYCSGHATDGFVDVEFVEEKVPAKRERDRALHALVEAGLWHVVEDGWMVNDFLEFNPSREQRAADHEAKSKAGRKGAAARWTTDETSSTSLACAKADAIAHAKAPANGTADGSDAPDPTRPDPTSSLRSDGAPGDVATIFDAWVQSTGRDPSRTKLTPERRRRIEKALKSHGPTDCLAAVTHIGRDPWAGGENDRGKPFNDVEHALGNAERIERWRDWRPTATAVDVRTARRRRRGAALETLMSRTDEEAA